MKLYESIYNTNNVQDWLFVGEDEIRLSSIIKGKAVEHICQPYQTKHGHTRLYNDDDASWPYVDNDGNINKMWREVEN